MIVAVGLAARVALVVALGIDEETFRLWEYDSIAGHIAAGEGHRFFYRDTVYLAYAPPLWSCVLAVLRLAFGLDVRAIQALQTACALGAAVVFASIARGLFGPRAALVTGIGIAIEPALAFYTVAHSDPLAWNALLLAGVTRTGVSLLDRPTRARAAWFGLCLGAATLSRGTPLVAVLVWAMVARRAKGVVPALAVTVTVAAASVAPWILRNARELGAPVFTSTLGENLWRGNHAGAGGGAHDLSGLLARDALPAELQTELLSPAEMDHHRAFVRAALGFWVERPGESLFLYARKVGSFVGFGVFEGLGYPAAAVVVYAIGHAGVLALMALRLATAREEIRRDSRERLILGIYVAIALTQAVFYVQGRHRALVEPLLIVVASGLFRVPVARPLTARSDT